jgi:hypothetical protein
MFSVAGGLGGLTTGTGVAGANGSAGNLFFTQLANTL